MDKIGTESFVYKIERDVLEHVKRKAVYYKDTSSYINDCTKYELKNMKIML